MKAETLTDIEMFTTCIGAVLFITGIASGIASFDWSFIMVGISLIAVGIFCDTDVTRRWLTR